jgi:hypothetical protein
MTVPRIPLFPVDTFGWCMGQDGAALDRHPDAPVNTSIAYASGWKRSDILRHLPFWKYKYSSSEDVAGEIMHNHRSLD